MRNDSGFTIGEALIATLLTLVVIVGSLTTLNDAMGITDLVRRTSDTNQELQSAMTMMVRDFMQVGQGIPTGGIPIPSGVGATPIARPSPQGSGLTFPEGGVVLPAISPGANLGPLVAGKQTDLVSVLIADPTIVLSEWPLATVATDGASATVDGRTSIAGPDGIKAGDLILFSNAQGSALQMVTRTADQTVFFDAGDPMNLNQRTAPQGTIIDLRAGPTTFPPTTATRVVLISYYVDAITDPALPRLVRQRNAGERLAIALGVEDFQVTFDLVDGTTNPTGVDSPVAPYSPHQIRLANLSLTGRPREATPTGQGTYKQSLATQVSLRSLSFLDRYQ